MTELQDKEIGRLQKTIDTKVPWVFFIATMTIFIAVIGWVFNVAYLTSAKTDQAVQRVARVEGDIKSINTSLLDIKSNLDYIRSRTK